MPADPNAPVPSDPPIYQSAPDLQVSMSDGFTHSPKHPKEKIWVSDQLQADEAGNEVFRWAYFNRFEVDLLEVSHTEWRETTTTNPSFRVVPVGDGMCQQEQATVEAEYSYKFALLKQYYEQWVTDTLLKDYYDTLLSPAAGAAGGGLGVAGLFGDLAYGTVTAGIAEGTVVTTTGTLGGAGATGAVASAGGLAAVGAAFVGAFLGTTAAMSQILEHTDVRSKGWAVIGKWKYDETPTGKTRTTWKKIGAPFPCPPRPETGGAAGGAAGAAGGADARGADARTTKLGGGGAHGTEAEPAPLWKRWWFLMLLAIFVVILIIAIVLFLLPRSAVTPGAAVDPSDEPTSAASVEDARLAPASCSAVGHTPYPFFPGSPSWYLLFLVVVAAASDLDGAAYEVDTPGADVNSVSGIVTPEGVIAAAVPVSSYADYAIGEVTLRGADGATETIPADSAAVAVTADERAFACEGDPTAVATMQNAFDSTSTGEQAARDFVDAFEGWHAAGDVDALAATLHPAVLHRYGAPQCDAYLAGVVGSISDIEVVEQRSEPWDYPVDGHTTQIPNSQTVVVDATLGGQRERIDLHLADYAGTVRWFTDCGDPQT
ncbi:hypothetical protein [uncultured Schumannella sp.]|uniref:hypothetical protein n=1 Tax=uncultured Schumannella sp. TaxID=1195956 RepID=UPI0025E5F833|nr:hypothetical protein [uncultured Schumannella sp.]